MVLYKEKYRVPCRPTSSKTCCARTCRAGTGRRQIERGKPNDAEQKFGEVERSASFEEPLLIILASGGLGIIEHARGHFNSAQGRYRDAIQLLQELQVSKPLALFQRYQGELRRAVGLYADARVDFGKSMQIAKTEGYFELVHEAQVSLIRNEIAEGTRPVGSVGWAETLSAAQVYAEKMDLVRLLCEVLRARTELLISQGESSVARPFIIRAIRIATLSGLTLRKLGYLELFSHIERMRGNEDGAARLFARLTETAGHLGLNLEHRGFTERPV